MVFGLSVSFRELYNKPISVPTEVGYVLLYYEGLGIHKRPKPYTSDTPSFSSSEKYLGGT